MSSGGTLNVPLVLAAALLGTVALLLLFAPEEVEAALVPGAAGGRPLVQAFGAALLGFAAMNWTARGSAVGGIYGRAILIANQTHLTVGAILLVTGAASAETVPAAFWLLTGLYVIGAVWFNWLTFFSSGLPRSRSNQ